MQARHSFLEALFAITNQDEPISEDNLNAIEATIKAIDKLSWQYSHEREVINQLKRTYPEFPLALPVDNILDQRDKDGCTLLHHACCRGHSYVAELLIKAKCNVNVRTIASDYDDEDEANSDTPLILASANSHVDIVTLLIKHHADINIINDQGSSALAHAAHENLDGIATLLLEAKADPNAGERKPLEYAAEMNNIAIAKQLIVAKANIEHKDEYGCTALSVALSYNSTEVASLLIDAKADVNCRAIRYDEFEQENIPTVVLEYALNEHNIPMIKMLLSAGADIPNPNALYKFLMSRNQYDPNVLASLEILQKREQTLRGSESSEDAKPPQKLHHQSYRKLTTYTQELSCFLKGADKDVENEIYKGTQLPSVVCELIRSYEETPAKFFAKRDDGHVEPKDVSRHLKLKAEGEEHKPSSKKRKARG